MLHLYETYHLIGKVKIAYLFGANFLVDQGFSCLRKTRRDEATMVLILTYLKEFVSQSQMMTLTSRCFGLQLNWSHHCLLDCSISPSSWHSFRKRPSNHCYRRILAFFKLCGCWGVFIVWYLMFVIQTQTISSFYIFFSSPCLYAISRFQRHCISSVEPWFFQCREYRPH